MSVRLSCLGTPQDCNSLGIGTDLRLYLGQSRSGGMIEVITILRETSVVAAVASDGILGSDRRERAPGS